MGGHIQGKHAEREVLGEVTLELSENESIALALSMCPEGESIEIHAADCENPANECTCVPRRIVKGPPS